MKKNPKIIAGLAALAVMLALGVWLLTRMIPTIQAVSLEASLTPTPLPVMPESIRAVTFSPTSETPVPPLSNGAQGERVRALQQRLKELGYDVGEVDGQFGAGTREAVRAFQQRNGLTADGIAGEETLRMLDDPEAKPAAE